ncbi:MAG: CvpA family protein [Pirellulales bacterium]
MQAYDLIMLIVLGVSAIFGAIKGLAWQIASLASIIVSYIVACRYRTQVAEMIDAQPPWNSFLAMLILYVGTGFVIWVGFRLLSGVIDKIRLKTFDRHLGALFGLGKGVIFCLLITMFAMTLLGTKQQAAICQSRSGYYISAFLDKAVLILPQEVHSTIGEYLARLDNQLKQGQQNQLPPDEGTGTFNASNLSNLTKELGQFLPNDLNQLIPQSNPNSWPNSTAQPNNFGSPTVGPGTSFGNGNGFGAGSGNAQPNTQPNGSSFGPNTIFGQPNSNFGNGGNQGIGSSSFGSGNGTGLRPSGGGSAELPSGVFPR